jgi:WD40 repeat protein
LKVHKIKQQAHSDAIWSLGWYRSQIVTGSVDEQVKLWDSETLEESKSFGGHLWGVVSVSVNEAKNCLYLSMHFHHFFYSFIFLSIGYKFP